jgi:serine/threonine-protein kinase
VRAGKGDRRGALRLALLYFLGMVGERFLRSPHTLGLDELNTFWKTIGVCGINAGAVWVFYLALEPWVRRRWPHTLISWGRFVTKGVRDPLVGRDLLYGIVFGAVWALAVLAQTALQGKGGEPLLADVGALVGTRRALAEILQAAGGTVINSLLFYFLLFLLRVVLRKPWIGAVAFIAVHAVFNTTFQTTHPWVDWPINICIAAIYALVLLRFGLLALMIADAAHTVLLAFPRTLDFSLWYAGIGVFPLVLVALMAVYAFRVALAGRPLIREDLL